MTTAIQYMVMTMKAEKFKLQYVLEMVEIINNSYLSAKDIVQILQQIFKNQKSIKILLAVNVLEYLVKNCNRNFHQAANRQSFQKSVLGLLKRQRGKTNIFIQIKSNTENWSRIQAKILYIIQLWYDTFILEEAKYSHIINIYKTLRKQNIVFPPRNVNQKNLMIVKTQSPIFDNIETIAQMDKNKFNKRLMAMGMPIIKDDKPIFQQTKKQQVNNTYWIDLDQISQKLAIIQSQEYEGENVLPVIEKLKKDLEFGKIKREYLKYWIQIRDAAELAITQWEQKHSELVKKKQENFLQMKMGQLNQNKSTSSKEQQSVPQQEEKKQIPQKQSAKQMDNWDLLGDIDPQKEKKSENIKQVNLLDL